MKKVVIIGAGPAGITAGYELVKKSRDYDVTILEESSQVGGIAKTVIHNGNRMDLGGHRFFTQSEEVKKWWDEILSKQGQPAKDDKALKRHVNVNPGGPDPEFEDEVMLTRKRVSSIYFNNKFFEYPVKFNSATVKNLGFGQTAKAGFSYIESSIFKKKGNNLENFYINRFGKQLYQTFFEGYTEKLWGRHPSLISADWGAQRFKGITVSSILKDKPSKNKSDNKDASTTLPDEFLYPKLGPGQMWELAADKYQQMGGKLCFGCHVNGIETENNVIKGVRYIRDNEEFTEEADIVISSMPMKDLIGCLKNVPFSINEVAKGLPYRDLVVLGVLLPSLKIQNTSKIKTINNIVPDCWIYVQDTSVKLGRIQIYNNWSPYLAQNNEENVWIGLEYFCNEGDYYWNQSDVQWQTLALAELVKLGIIEDPPIVLDFHKELVKKAYPAYFDTYSRFDEIVRFLDGYPNLYCVGRNGQHRYNNMDHTMMTSLETVRNILAGRTEKTKIWSVNMSAEHHEHPNTSLLTPDSVRSSSHVEKPEEPKPSYQSSVKLPKVEGAVDDSVKAAEEDSKKKGFNPMASIRNRLSQRSFRKPKQASSAVNYALLAEDKDGNERNSYRNAAIPIRSNYQEPAGNLSAASSSPAPIRRKPSGVRKDNETDTYVVGSKPVKKESPMAIAAAEAAKAENNVPAEPVKETPLFTTVQTFTETVPETAPAEPVYEASVEEYAAPAEPVYEEPVEEYAAPAEPVYEAPVEEYAAPVEPVYEAPVEEYAAPEEPVYEAPVEEYAAPEEPVYEAPVEEYAAPAEPVYEAPVEEYAAPAEPVYEAPATEYAMPAEDVAQQYYEAGDEASAEGYGNEEYGYYDDFGSRNEEYDSTYAGVYSDEYQEPVYDTSYNDGVSEYGYETAEPEQEEVYPAQSTEEIAESEPVQENAGIQKSNDFGTIFAMPTEDEARKTSAKFDMPYVPVEQPVISLVPKKEEKKEFLNQTGASYAMEKIDKVLKTEITLKPRVKEEEPQEMMVVSVPKPSYKTAKGVFTPKPMTEEEKKKLEEEERARRPIAPSINFKKVEEPKKEEEKPRKSIKPRKRNFVRPTVPITADWEAMNAKTLRELPEMEASTQSADEKEIKVQKSDLPNYDIYGEMSFSAKKKKEEALEREEAKEKFFDAASAIAASIQSAQEKEAKFKEISEARAQYAMEQALEEAKARKEESAVARSVEQIENEGAPAQESADKAPVTPVSYTPKKSINDIEVPKDLFANAKVIAVIKNGVKQSSTTDGKTGNETTVKKQIQKFTSDFETTTVKSIRKLRAKRQEEAIQSISAMLQGTGERKIVEPRAKKPVNEPAPVPGIFSASTPVQPVEVVPLQEPAPAVVEESVPAVVEEPVPAAVVETVPVAVEENIPVVEEPIPVAVEEPTPVIAEEPVPVLAEETTPVVSKTPEPVVAKEPEPVKEEVKEPSIKLDLRLKDGSHRTAPIPLNRGTTLFTPITEFSESQIKSTYRDVRSEEEVKESLKDVVFEELPADSFRKYDEIKHAVIPEMTEKELEGLGIRRPTEESPESVPAPEKPAPKKRGRKPKAVVEAEKAAAAEENAEPKEELVKKPRKPRAKKTAETEGQIALEMNSDAAVPAGETAAPEEAKPKRTYRKRATKTAEEGEAGEDTQTVRKTTRKPKAKKEETNDGTDNIGE